ncbi:hypothetical protein [Ramlibacter sp. PS4R-6]|uniref:hypothetical protein n=1 Tax=Ramlibacter sp. PS4R-6 TaxID=3133438 RepID=UPI0030B62019
MWPISSPQKLGEDAEAAAMERFRGLMLGLLEGDPGEKAAMLNLRIRCAATLQSLWFMRSEMMALLAAEHGEAEARHRLDRISAVVRDQLPSGLRSRPSPLARDA